VNYSVYKLSLNYCSLKQSLAVCLFRAADVLLAGAVLNRVFQPHEVHIPYVLQVSFTNVNYFLNYANKLESFFEKHSLIFLLELC